MTPQSVSNSKIPTLVTICLLLASQNGFACAANSQQRIDPVDEKAQISQEAQDRTGDGVDDDAIGGAKELVEPRQGEVLGFEADEDAGGIEGDDGLEQSQDVLVEELIEIQRLQLAEIIGLYQRLHIELDRQGRSNLVIDLFADHRTEIQLLGFELVERDLSSQSDVPPEIGQATRDLINVENPIIRAKAASLITRLVLSDAMLLLTDALISETDPVAAEPMLSGIARWPNEQAIEPVMRWLLRDDSPFEAACDAAWALEEQGLWNVDNDAEHEKILTRLRQVPPETLTLSCMKLLAKIGSSQDLDLLVSLLSSKNTNQQQSAATALVETPRATEVLIQAAEMNSRFFGVASTSLALHRATPEGLRRLSMLPFPDADTRADAFRKMGEAIDDDRLGEAVKLASIEPDLAISMLNRLLSNPDHALNSRSAKGVLLLVSLELNQSRPNRALEGLGSLDGVPLDTSDQHLMDRYKLRALILLGKFDEAHGLSMSQASWIETFSQVQDAQLLSQIAQSIDEAFHESLTDEERDLLKPYLPHEGIEKEPDQAP